MPRPREVVGVAIPAGKAPCPAVVLYVDDSKIFVIYATSTHRPDRDAVVVQPRERAGINLGISNPSYFYRGSIAVCAPEAVHPWRGRCTLELFERLREHAETTLLAFLAEFAKRSVALQPGQPLITAQEVLDPGPRQPPLRLK